MLHWSGVSEGARAVRSMGMTEHPMSSHSGDLLDVMGAVMRFKRNAEIFGQDEPATYLYRVVRGAVRIVRLMSDGRRQISAFYLAGDMFGLEDENEHLFSAEAVTETEIRYVRRSVFLAEAMRDTDMITELWAQTKGNLQRAHNHMLLLGRKNAQERVAKFLLDMEPRLSRSGIVELPMSRQDIADYLGLTIETVSRTLTQLARESVIAMPSSRRIEFRKHSTLSQLRDSLTA